MRLLSAILVLALVSWMATAVPHSSSRISYRIQFGTGNTDNIVSEQCLSLARWEASNMRNCAADLPYVVNPLGSTGRFTIESVSCAWQSAGTSSWSPGDELEFVLVGVDDGTVPGTDLVSLGVNYTEITTVGYKSWTPDMEILGPYAGAYLQIINPNPGTPWDANADLGNSIRCAVVISEAM